MDKLPDEIIIIILSKFNVNDLLSYSLINKKFAYLCRCDVLWKQLVFNKFGIVDKVMSSWLQNYKHYLKYSVTYLVTFIGYETKIIGVYSSEDIAFKNVVANYLNVPVSFPLDIVEKLYQDNPELDRYYYQVRRAEPHTFFNDKYDRVKMLLIPRIIEYLNSNRENGVYKNRHGCYFIKKYTIERVFFENAL